MRPNNLDTRPSLPDLLEPGLQVIFCGINPGLRAASTGHHFEGRNNRFWRVLHLAGFTPEQIHPQDDRTVLRYGCGLTTAAPRATARAAELTRSELALAADALRSKIEQYAPRYIAFLGKMAFSAIYGTPDIKWGLQDQSFGGARAWILPNPSGLNRAFDLDALVAAYRELRIAATAMDGAR